MDLTIQTVPVTPTGSEKTTTPRNRQSGSVASPALAPTPAAAKAASSQPTAGAAPGTGGSQQVSQEAPPLPVTMNPILWIGFGFLVALVVFLMFSIYKPPPKNSRSRGPMRFLTALCGGFAGGLLTGAALFNMTFAGAGTKTTISGSAGIAILFTIWFTFDKWSHAIDAPDSVPIDIPSGWTFQMVADSLAKKRESGIDYGELNDSEKEAEMKSQILRADSIEHLLESLRSATVNAKIRSYRVEHVNGCFVFTVSS